MSFAFQRVLIANRGEIACRAIRTLNKLGLTSLAVYAPADAQSLHVRDADIAIALGGNSARESYLNVEKLFDVAREHGAQAVFPGYGFLSESADFAARCEAAGMAFIGPTPEQIRAFGLKHAARELARSAAVPLLPGTGLLQDVAAAVEAAQEIGYPVMLKSTAGGGGIGLSVCHSESELAEAFARAVHLAQSHFADGGVFVEKFVARARHIEVQVFGDGQGKVISLGERDCSVQRRNQKVLEETPAPNLPAHTRNELSGHAVRLLEQLHYRSAGTVEFVYDAETGKAYFLEVNTRLQVEHGITERVTGVDLVQWMLLTAQGKPPDLGAYIHAPLGHAIEVRLYAENPQQNYRPSSGLITGVQFPAAHSLRPSVIPPRHSSAPPAPESLRSESLRPDSLKAESLRSESLRPDSLKAESLRPGQRSNAVRVDTWIEAGIEVSPLFDPLLAKLIVWGPHRDEALSRLSAALEATRIDGIETNLHALSQVVLDPDFELGGVTTKWLEGLSLRAQGLEVLDAGRYSTLQDYPGRSGYWSVGIPPSGAMDGLALRLANRVLGNPEGATGLEMTGTGVSLRFLESTVVCLSGADMQATLDGAAVPRYTPVTVQSGQVLKLREIAGPGARAYLCVHGGFDVPEYLGSRSTFTLGRFGGHAGRTLQVGDVLHLDKTRATQPAQPLPHGLEPELSDQWRLRVTLGPHAAPDFFTEQDIATFFETDWKVHYNSARTGVRLLGPKPTWARPDGGDAGLHPSNIHDCAYAFGAVDYTGDMPIVLGPDGPSLGGFVCPATVIAADLWKLGQLKPGDSLRFEPVTWSAAVALEQTQTHEVQHLLVSGERWDPTPAAVRPVFGRVSAAVLPADVRLQVLPASAISPEVCYRPAGDKFLLVEYGPMTLDLALRFRVHALSEWLASAAIPGVLETTPGIRSLQVHYDSQVLRLEELVSRLVAAEAVLPDTSSLRIPSRVVHLPLSWDDEATQLAIEKYTQLVRKDAPWAPSNIEFIRRINGLESTEDVRRIVYDASYLVLGLGDVYLGAPVATPIDPRHRLVTTKYNPARTWTPENAVGIGGAYLCIYGMEGPGGYQFVGRTLQMYNRFRSTRDFEPGKPWLLRHFDQIRFFPVDGKELLSMREAFAAGRLSLSIEERVFDLAEYQRFLSEIAPSAEQFREQQSAAFEAERQRWVQSGQLHFESDVGEATVTEENIPVGHVAVASPVPGSIWRTAVQIGDRVEAEQTLITLESMKMEMPISAPVAGVVSQVRCSEGAAVTAGQVLVVIEPEPVAAPQIVLPAAEFATDSAPDEFAVLRLADADKDALLDAVSEPLNVVDTGDVASASTQEAEPEFVITSNIAATESSATPSPLANESELPAEAAEPEQSAPSSSPQSQGKKKPRSGKKRR